MYINKVIYLIVILMTYFLFSCINIGLAREYSFSDVETALEHLRVGEFAKVTHRLLTIMNNSDRRVGERAALALGNILVQNQRAAEALTPLRRAINGRVGPDYARFIFSLAVVEGELKDNYSEATKYVSYLYTADKEQISPILRHKAHFLLFKLHFLQGKWRDAIHAGETFLKAIEGEISTLTGDEFCERRKEEGLLLKKSYCRMQEETRWLTAEAYRQLRNYHKAYTLYESIWYETPAGTWADKARQMLRNLEERVWSIKPKRRSTSEYYEFIRRVWEAGLHKMALQEIADFLKDHSDYSKADQILYMKIRILHALWRNANAVSTMETMRRRYPDSEWLPAAGIYAIKALRRSDNTQQIRYWVNWVVKNYPGHEKSIEALYNLGVYLCNVVSKEEGMKVLWRVIRDGSQNHIPHRLVDDAFWKIIWVQRNLKRTDSSVETLEELLRTYARFEYSRKAEYRKAALYWLGRFKEPDNRREAIKHFQTVLKEYPNDYYGHRAKEQLIRLGMIVDLKRAGNRKPFPPVDRLNDPDARDNPPEAYFRAITLKSLGLYEFAVEELETLSEIEEDSGIQFALADLYARAGNTWSAIIIINRYFREFLVAGSQDPALVPMDFWYIVYPFHYRQEIEKSIRESQRSYVTTGIDPYLIAALIRSESLFYPRAISNVGAIGLMQLMPNTVKKMSKKYDLGNISRSELFEPAVNIRLGTLYLAGRVNEFKNNWFPAICSYNAGTRPVKKWWKNKPKNQPLDEFVENILYPQTRTYIKNVLGARDNYEWIYP
ncbi:hypothetical protein PN36_06305 [Candidatus Thiomargarita nelsonii]|uniref:Transglycosylase SLT domain-containing protein n=1 Tax=Candidatus Thiomargarita nelsonii TaxID=1003181 RepID=A0A4E0QRB9_9GAMM|nr:hypothetical protein PN36_06305 [Candidatus Thiomargarita nelsonii]